MLDVEQENQKMAKIKAKEKTISLKTIFFECFYKQKENSGKYLDLHGNTFVFMTFFFFVQIFPAKRIIFNSQQ